MRGILVHCRSHGYGLVVEEGAGFRVDDERLSAAVALLASVMLGAPGASHTAPRKRTALGKAFSKVQQNRLQNGAENRPIECGIIAYRLVLRITCGWREDGVELRGAISVGNHEVEVLRGREDGRTTQDVRG